jgi:acetylornithine deacetylase/succinyl-diaminopimelate desuccinylase-like protein
MTAAVRAISAATGEPPLPVRSGGTIPALTALDETGTVKTSVLLGFGHPCDRAHGPEESVDRRQLDLAAATVAGLLKGYGDVRR